MLGFIKRCTSQITNVISLKIFYCALIRSHLDYSSSVWSLFYRIHVKIIWTHTQHKLGIFTSEINYGELELKLGFSTLEPLRKQRDLLWCIKYPIKIPCHELLHRINFRIPSKQIRSIFLFIKQIILITHS